MFYQSEGSQQMIQVPGCDGCTGCGHDQHLVLVVAPPGEDASNVFKLLIRMTITDVIGRTGQDGRGGRDGRTRRNARHRRDGRDRTVGTDGRDRRDGWTGRDRRDRTDGTDGMDGTVWCISVIGSERSIQVHGCDDCTGFGHDQHSVSIVAPLGADVFQRS